MEKNRYKNTMHVKISILMSQSNHCNIFIMNSVVVRYDGHYYTVFTHKLFNGRQIDIGMFFDREIKWIDNGMKEAICVRTWKTLCKL